MKIIFATGNEGKLKEVRQILPPDRYEIVSMKEAGYDLSIEETGTTFAENSLLKARAVTLASGQIAMADDSGLVIDAFGGKPGIYSARFLGHDTPYPEKNRQILEMLAEVPEEKRSARYVCAITCVFPDGRVIEKEETLEGRIAWAAAGENGFGYDPIFFVPEKGCTTAQMSPEEKHAISHRGKALREMAAALEKIRTEEKL